MTYDTINDDKTIAGNGEGTLLANRYRVVRQLGQGGMGSVWLAEDTQLDNKSFAIKMLPSILVSNKRAYRQLKDEALVAMKLTHPNIVTLRAFEENNGNPFLVMDYVDGQTLDNYLAEYTGTTGVSPVEHGIPESDVLRILRPIAAALDYAHGEGVVHRDVKPANVMIRKDGHPFILDFGIAREIQETMTHVTGKLSSGTLLYMSPEQLMGEQPRPAQDIYSFAAMAYECMKGEPPFVRGAIEDQIKNKQPDPPPGGTQLVASVMAGLAKKPEDRPETCSSIVGLSGVKMTFGAIPPQPSAERFAPSRAPSGRQDVAERLLQSAQAVLEVDRMLAEVAKFEGSCKDPKVHSSWMAIKAARREMESASGTRCMELLEAVKAIFAEAKSAYDDSVAKRHFIDEISEFLSGVRGRHELRFESGVDACLHEIEQLKEEAEKASAGAWQELRGKFLRAREKTEAEVRSAFEKNREMAEKRRLAEADRRQQEELKKRQELEERKRKEQAEIESYRTKVEAAKQEIRDECEKVVAYVRVHPGYGDCLPIAKEIYASTNEEEPADLTGLCERLEKLARDLERIRRLISSHDVVVCATLNGAEVGRASMLYGGRRIDLPVRIKRRHRLTQDEGYLLEYAHGIHKYYGWFSPACVKSAEGQCAMVPLYGEPSIPDISRAYRKKKPVKFLWDVFVALIVSLEGSVLVSVVAYGAFILMGRKWATVAAVVCGIVSVVLDFLSRYSKSVRREMRWAICGNGQYRMLQQSNFSESELLLNRKDRSASEMFKGFKLHDCIKLFWRLLVALYFALHIGLLVCICACICVGFRASPCVVLLGLLAFLAASFFSCKRALRRERWGALIGFDDYRARRVEAPAAKAAKESPEEDRVQTGKSNGHLVLWIVAICILAVGGFCCWQYSEKIQKAEELRARQAEIQADRKAKAEKKRRNEEIRRKNAEMARRQAEEKRRKAEEAEAAEKRRRESAEIESVKKEIDDEVRAAERKVREAEEYRGDPVGFENHLAALDAAAVKLKIIPVPNTIAKAKAVLQSVNDAGTKISSELDWLSKNKPLHDEAKRIEDEMKATLDAELVRFEASSIVADSYSRGMTLRQEGNNALRNGDFHSAQKKLAEAKDVLKRALDAAKPIHEKRVAKETAIALFKIGKWQNGLESAKKAEQNDPELLFWIGTYFDKVLGDQQQALLCIIQAAKKGLPDAQLELGRRYEDRQEFAEAEQWYQKAASQGSQQAKEKLRLLSEAQRRKELEEAERRKREEREREQEEARLRTPRENVARLRESTGDETARAAIPPSGELQVLESERTSREFTEEDANSLLRLKFPPEYESLARQHYEKARDLARKGIGNMPKVKDEYNKGRYYRGPKWPELERWLDWWK